MDSRDAMGQFARAFAEPDRCVGDALAAGRRPIRTLGIDAPFALLRAKGFQPVRLAGVAGVTPLSDAIMGSKGLGARGRRLLEAILAPAHPGIPLLITTADVEQTQLFATLRELSRLGEAALPPVFLLDLCHQPRDASRRYTRQRLDECAAWLDTLDGTRMPVAAPAAEDLGEMRRSGRLSGTAALHVAGSAAILPGDAHQALSLALRAELADLPMREGPRLYLSGSLNEDDRFYAAIEALGATIVGEDHGWGGRFVTETAIVAPASEPPATVAARVAAAALACDATHVLHLTIGADEVAPWQIAPLRQALGDTAFLAVSAELPDDRFSQAVATLLTGVAIAPRPTTPKISRSPALPAASERRETRSRKALASLADFGRYQREWFAGVRARAAAGEHFAVVNANAPQEILRALDIPFVVNQWWASIVAAKQQSRRYLGLLRHHDLPAHIEPYSAQGLAAAFDDDEQQAPWGGLPRPDFIQAIRSSDATAGIFGDWAAVTGADCYLYERTVDPGWTIATDWWSDLPDRWDEVLEPGRIDLFVAELREVIARLQAATGRTFDPARFEDVLHLVNEQEEWYRRTRDLIARTVPAPIGVADQMPATMVPQWHRGTEWGRDAAKAFHDEVAARVAGGEGAVREERVRLMWVGRGLWSEMGFYQRWEESHGAVFVCSMYLSLAADGYIRNFDRGRDPMRALAARFLTMGDELRMPSWAAPWHVHEARLHQVDGAVALADADPFVLRALERDGIPVLDLGVDNFNREGADADAIDARITAFIEGPAGAQAARRRGANA